MNKAILNGVLDTLNTPFAYEQYMLDLIRAVARDAVENGNMESKDVLGMIFFRYGDRLPLDFIKEIKSILGIIAEDKVHIPVIYSYLWKCSADQGSLVGMLNLSSTHLADVVFDMHRPVWRHFNPLAFFSEPDKFDFHSTSSMLDELQKYILATAQGGTNRVPFELASSFCGDDAGLRYLILHANLLVYSQDAVDFLKEIRNRQIQEHKRKKAATSKKTELADTE